MIGDVVYCMHNIFVMAWLVVLHVWYGKVWFWYDMV